MYNSTENNIDPALDELGCLLREVAKERESTGKKVSFPGEKLYRNSTAAAADRKVLGKLKKEKAVFK